MCGYCDSGEDEAKETGMAPDAQLMVYDFGDAEGNLNVPTTYAGRCSDLSLGQPTS
jgi:hypothetical protein